MTDHRLGPMKQGDLQFSYPDGPTHGDDPAGAPSPTASC